MSSVSCPHCVATNVAGAAFCESCGKALPDPNWTGPRLVSTTAMPTTAAGSRMLGDQLLKHTKRAANTLLVVGIIQLVIGALLGAVLSNARQASSPDAAVLVAVTFTLGAIFIGLSFWARRSPLPAAIVGVVLYSTLILLNVIQNAAALANSDGAQRGRGIGGLGVGWLDIVIIVFLAQGVKAALEHRKLLKAPVAG